MWIGGRGGHTLLHSLCLCNLLNDLKAKTQKWSSGSPLYVINPTFNSFRPNTRYTSTSKTSRAYEITSRISRNSGSTVRPRDSTNHSSPTHSPRYMTARAHIDSSPLKPELIGSTVRPTKLNEPHSNILSFPLPGTNRQHCEI